MIVALWKVFTKAGRPGWAAIIPILQHCTSWCKIAGRPGWWVILMLIPLVNFIVGIIVCIDMAKSFGKGVGFGIGIALLPNHFPSDPRLRQRSVPRTVGGARVGGFSATAARLDRLTQTQSRTRISVAMRVIPNTLTEPRS